MLGGYNADMSHFSENRKYDNHQFLINDSLP